MVAGAGAGSVLTGTERRWRRAASVKRCQQDGKPSAAAAAAPL